MKLALAQIALKTGDVRHNLAKLKQIWSENQECDLVVFPELCISGYPLEDLVENKTFLQHCKQSLADIISFSKNMKSAALISAPVLDDGKVHNALFLIEGGKILSKIFKSHLPNYGVFDEKRNFKAGRNNRIVEFRGKKLGLLICEDAWGLHLPEKLADMGAELLISVNASPYDIRKAVKRDKLAQRIIAKSGLDLVYLNMIQAQDGIVFDGGSFVMRKDGSYLLEPRFWSEEVIAVSMSGPDIKSKTFSKEEQMYNALILGLREYINNNGFSKVLLGVSGGIDSAFVAQLTFDAIGKDAITAVRMPSKYSSTHSLSDAQKLCDHLGIKCITLPINDTVNSACSSLQSHVNIKAEGLTEENLQSRMRGTLLMAISNNTGALLLSCGNKSEYATGYATLYGDMNGGFAPIKDIYKTQVYTLAKWRNKNIPSLAYTQKLGAIPQESIYKAPSAELSPGQLDQDTLPPYDALDQILYELIERDHDPETLSEDERFEDHTVRRVHNMLRATEYKRKQAAIGTKISERSLSKDRRYPITNLFRSVK